MSKSVFTSDSALRSHKASFIMFTQLRTGGASQRIFNNYSQKRIFSFIF